MKKSGQILCFYGWGPLLEQNFHQIVQIVGQRPDYICDGDPIKWGCSLNEVVCVDPTFLLSFNSLRVIITARDFSSIGKTLFSFGISNWEIAIFEQTRYRIRKIIENVDLNYRTTQPVQSIFGKLALVTGASRGLGRAIAIFLASHGCNLLLHARYNRNLDKVIEECKIFGVDAKQLACDFEDRTDLECFLETLDGLNPDFLINNAAYSPPIVEDDFFNIPISHYDACFGVNALSPILLMSRLIPKMVSRSYGRVINISTSLQKKPSTSAYAISKSALNKFVTDLYSQLEGTGVNIFCVDPGALSTDMSGGIGFPVETALPGCLIPVFCDIKAPNVWLNAQDYRGLSIEDSISRYELISTIKD